LELRIKGWSQQDIASELNITPGRVSQILTEERARLNKKCQEDAGALRDYQAARLDIILKPQLDRAKDGDTAAANTVLRILDRRSKLFGLDLEAKPDLGGLNPLAQAIHDLLEQSTISIPKATVIEDTDEEAH